MLKNCQGRNGDQDCSREAKPEVRLSIHLHVAPVMKTLDINLRSGRFGTVHRPCYKNLLSSEVANIERVAFTVTTPMQHLGTRQSQEHDTARMILRELRAPNDSSAPSFDRQNEFLS